MSLKRLLYPFNIGAQCRDMGIKLRHCPQFIFLIMGVVIIATVLLTYYIGRRYADGEIVALIIIALAAFLIVIAYTIVKAFEEVVAARQQERDRLQEIVDLRDQFVFIAAHELRTPANAIKWGLSALKSETPELSEKGKKFFSIVERSNERLLSLVRDLLQTARIENKTLSVARSPVSVIDTFQAAADELSELFEKQQVQVINEIPNYTPPVQADETRLKEMFVNLLSNAAKYNEKGGVVRVSAEVTGDQVIVHVADDGVGIPADEQEHVFEKFWHADTQEGEKSTGLGLFITKKLLELMGGEIRFSSAAGEGTTFSFLLDRAETDAQEGIDTNAE